MHNRKIFLKGRNFVSESNKLVVQFQLVHADIIKLFSECATHYNTPKLIISANYIAQNHTSTNV